MNLRRACPPGGARQWRSPLRERDSRPCRDDGRDDDDNDPRLRTRKRMLGGPFDV